MNKLIYSFVISFFFISLQAQESKIDKCHRIKKGKLENGITYYLCDNPNSPHRASFYLLQNTGSLVENDNQIGLAHFIEHMCFAGSKNFPKYEFLNFLDSHGLKSHANGGTMYEETFISLQNIPTTNSAIFYNCLLGIHDMCSFLTLDEDQINRERLIISEEIRQRNNAQSRIDQKSFPIIYNNAKWCDRNIGGDIEFIKTFKRKNLVDYYKKWYRPDLQAVVVIGDIDIKKTESIIKKMFSDIPKPTTSLPKNKFLIDDNNNISFSQITDDEIYNGAIIIRNRHKINYNVNYVDRLKKEYKYKLLNTLTTNRARLLKQHNKKIINNLSIQFEDLCRDYRNYCLRIYHRPNKAKKALRLTIGMLKDIFTNGFTEKEFNDVVHQSHLLLSNMNKGEIKRNNYFFFERIKANFYTNRSILSNVEKYKIFKSLTKELTREDLTKELTQLYNGKNKNIFVLCNGIDSSYLNKYKIMEIEKSVLPLNFESYRSKKSNTKYNESDIFVCPIENNGKENIVNTEKLDDINAMSWILSNGCKVLFKKTNNNAVNISAVSLGGKYQVPEDYKTNTFQFNNLSVCVSVDGCDPNSFRNYLIKNRTIFQMMLFNHKEQISLVSDVKHIEIPFKTLNHLITNPSFDNKIYSSAYDHVMNNFYSSLRDPNKAFRDSVYKFTTPNSLYFKIDKNIGNYLSIEKFSKIYKDRFTNIGNYNIYITGNISYNTVEDLIKKYIVPIHQKKQKQKHLNITIPYSKGCSRKIIKTNAKNHKALDMLLVTKQHKYSQKDKLCYKLIQSYLQKKLTEILREDQVGTYSVTVRSEESSYGIPYYRYIVNYMCNPTRIEKLSNTVLKLLPIIFSRGMNKKEFEKIKKLHSIQDGNQNVNIYYTRALVKYVEENINIDDDKKLLDSIDLKYINNCMKKFIMDAGALDVWHIYTNK